MRHYLNKYEILFEYKAEYKSFSLADSSFQEQYNSLKYSSTVEVLAAKTVRNE